MFGFVGKIILKIIIKYSGTLERYAGDGEQCHGIRVGSRWTRAVENMISSQWSLISSKRSMYTLLSCPLTLT
jgi:hypothetical protein